MIELRVWRRVVAVGAVLLLGAAGVVLAQGAPTGNLFVRVVDETGSPLPGVPITVSGFGAPRVQVSDGQGHARFVSLDPGRYDLRAALEGFSTVEQANIDVRTGRNTDIQVQLSSAVEEVITVTAESPLLDERRLSTGTSISQIELEKIPTSRDPWAILTQTPGVLVDRINVGGNESGQQSIFVGQGASSDENAWLVDGIETTDMRATGASSTYYDFDQFAEIEMSTGGTDVTKNSAGVGINLVTKRGTNEFRGSARFYVTDGGGQFEIFDQADPKISSGDLGPGQTEFIGNRINRVEDYGFEVGGPLVRDRAWLWGAWSVNDIKNFIPGAGPGGLTADDTILENTSMKLNLQLSPANSAVASWNNGDKRKFGRDASPTRPPETTWNQRGPSAIWKVEDTHIFSPNLFLTGTWSHLDFGFVLAAQGGAGDDAPRSWQDGDGVWQDSFLSGGAASPEDQFKVDGSYFFNTGQATSHEIKFGGRYRDYETNSAFSWPGGDVFSLALAGGDFPLVGARRGISGPDMALEYTSLWVQDTIAAGRFTYNIGLRYDIQDGESKAVQARANPFFPELMPALDFGGEKSAFKWEDIQPRAGITYALGDGRKTLLRGSFAQFAEQLDSFDVTRTNPVGDAYAYFLNLSKIGDPNGFFEPGDELVLIDWVGFDPENPAALISPNVTDRNYKAEITSELLVGLEHAFLPEFVAGVNLTYRLTEDIQENRPFVRDAAGNTRLATAADYVPDTVLTGDLPNGQPYSVQTFALDPSLAFTGGSLRTSGDRDIEYLGFGVHFTKRLANRWMARGNVQYGEAEWDIGSGSQFRTFNEPNPRIFPGRARIGGDIDGGVVALQSAGSGAKADVIIQSGWSFNVNGMYQVAPDRPWGFNVAGNLFGREGYPLPYFRSFVGADGVNRQIRVVDKLDDFRTDDIFVTDLSLSKDLGVRDDLNFTVSIDLFNAFNENYVMQRARDLSTGQADWLRETLSPRIFRLGVTINWK